MTNDKLSTSLHIEVAMKFSGEQGMILEMDNANSITNGMYCSWMSRYVEQEEMYVLCTNIIPAYYIIIIVFYIVYFLVILFHSPYHQFVSLKLQQIINKWCKPLHHLMM